MLPACADKHNAILTGDKTVRAPGAQRSFGMKKSIWKLLGSIALVAVVLENHLIREGFK
jgi:hypothetical protein